MSNTKPMALIRVMWAIRDCRLTRNAERQLLDAIALRVNPAKGYKCWPSYELLSKDTGLNVATLKKAAAGLEKKRLIRRSIRHNKSNIFTLNVDLLVRAAEIQLAADKAKKEAAMEAEAFSGEDHNSAAAEEETEYQFDDPMEYGNPFPDRDGL